MKATAIECKLIRAGGTLEKIENTEYHFQPYTDGAHVCEVANEEHADRFLSIREGYRLYRGEGKPVNSSAAAPSAKPAAPATIEQPASATAPAILYGAGGDFLSSFDIHGKTYALGDIVVRAHEASGLSVDAWNALPDDERDGKIEAELNRIDAAGPVQESTPPAADDRATLAAEYERLYGKKPHHNTGIDKLRELIAAKQ